MGAPLRERSLAHRYLAAFAIIGAALLLRCWLLPIDARPAFMTFSPALVLCFLLCGTWPSVAAMLVSAAITYVMFIPPFGLLTVKPSGAVATVFFVVSSLLVGLITRRLGAREVSLEQVATEQNAILDSELLGVARVRDGRFVWSNRGVETLLGYAPGELTGLPTAAVYPKKSRFETAQADAYTALENGETFRSEVKLETKSGGLVWVDVTGKLLVSVSGVREFLWLFADITARKEAEFTISRAKERVEQALAATSASEARYRLLAENANDMIATMATDSTVLFVTPAVRDVLGYAPDEVIGRRTLDLTHPDDVGLATSIFTGLIKAGPGAPTAAYEFRARHKNGTWVWLEGQPRVEFDADGKPVCFQDVVRDITARKLAESALRTSQSFLARTSQAAGVGGWEYDIGSGAVLWSDETCRLHDVPPGHRPTLDEAIGYYADGAQSIIAKAVADGVHLGKSWDLELPIISAAGRKFWARAVGMAEAESSRTVRLIGAFQDVTEARRMAHELAESHELLKVTLNSIGDAVITTDAQGHVTWLNPVAERLTGCGNESARGQKLADVFSIVDQTTRAQMPIGWNGFESESIASHTGLLSKDGVEYGVEGSVSPLLDAEKNLLGSVVVFRDVSEQRKFGREMAFRATHDTLTGLPNRAEFESRLEQLIDRTDRSIVPQSVLFIDLDRFKLVNDSCGHAEGDRLLRRIAVLLCDSIRSSTTDTVARLGGDEFGMILENCDVFQAAQVGQKICNQMAQFVFPHEGQDFSVGASIGLVQVDSGWTSISALLHAADMACYVAKRSGRNRVQIYAGGGPDAPEWQQGGMPALFRS